MAFCKDIIAVYFVCLESSFACSKTLALLEFLKQRSLLLGFNGKTGQWTPLSFELFGKIRSGTRII